MPYVNLFETDPRLAGQYLRGSSAQVASGQNNRFLPEAWPGARTTTPQPVSNQNNRFLPEAWPGAPSMNTPAPVSNQYKDFLDQEAALNDKGTSPVFDFSRVPAPSFNSQTGARPVGTFLNTQTGQYEPIRSPAAPRPIRLATETPPASLANTYGDIPESFFKGTVYENSAPPAQEVKPVESGVSRTYGVFPEGFFKTRPITGNGSDRVAQLLSARAPGSVPGMVRPGEPIMRSRG